MNACPSCGTALANGAVCSCSAATCEVERAGWFYARGKIKHGPVSFAELQALAAQGQLAATDMLLPAGSQQWQTAGSVAGLLPKLATMLADPGTGTMADLAQTVAEATAPVKAANQASVAGFEILGVLGRGGMGVVYKARHERLNRLVALKMILGGDHAGPDQLDRFLIEARAIAQLDHPGIVQIHEIGEQDHQPWFALEYVEGGSLAQALGDRPIDPATAARVLESLARTMHYAHQRGIIHRDLKPANILLRIDQATRQGDASTRANLHAAIPKITDFGLAKQLNADSGQTQSGAILGTPSYMAPEQAAGRIRDIGPHTDVYALGAILYEMLTGRPPFRGETAMDTLILVAMEEPTPPSQLRPGIPRDLETICLTALAKEPKNRGGSALALAQDLERFQAGEPILSRRESPLRKLWRQVRRRPARAAAVLALVALLGSGLVAWNALRHSKAQGRVTELMSKFDSDFGAADNLVPHLEEREVLLAELAALDAARADEARQKLHQRFAAAIRDAFAFHKHPVLEAGQREKIETALTALAARDADLARTLRGEYAQRQSAFERVALAQPPFTQPGIKELFGKAPIQATAASLAVTGTEPLRALTRVPCGSNVEMRARFAPGWDQASQLGLLLNAGPTDRGYSFTLQATPSFARARATQGAFALAIRRHGAILRELELPAADLPEGGLTIVARRQGDRLLVQVGALPPLLIRDAFPLLQAEAGAFGLVWPAEAALEHLELWRQTGLASAASPLERGDDAYNRGDFNAALAEFQTQANSSTDPRLSAEARYKQALCLIALQRDPEAIPLLKALAGDATFEQWHLLGACQLWSVYLGRNQDDEAEALFATLSTGQRFEQLAVVMPESLRTSILDAYLLEARSWGAFQLQLFNKNRIRDLSRTLAVQEYFQADARRRQTTLLALARAYFLEDQLPQAMRMLELYHKSQPRLPAEQTDGWFQACEEYCWLLRVQGQAEPALTWLDGKLMNGDKPRWRHEPLLLERARIHAALGRWAEAEADLDLFFQRVQPGDVLYRFYAGACLIRGFLLDRKDDAAGARAAWLKGMPGSHPSYHWLHYSSALTVAHSTLSAGLSNAFTAKHAQEVWDRLSSRLSARNALGGRLGVLLSAVLPKNPPFEQAASRFCSMCQAGEGRALARHVAFQDVALRALVFDAIRTGIRGFARSALPPLDADQEKLLGQMAEGLTNDYAGDQFTQTQLLQMSLSFGLLTRGNAAAWQGVASNLTPSRRAPGAYFVGLHFLELKQPAEAAKLFQAALSEVGDDALLKRLADAELKRLATPSP